MNDQAVAQQAGLIGDEIESSLQSMAAIKTEVYNRAVNTRIFGKTVDQWHKELSIKIDPGAEPARVKYYASQIAEALEIAYANLARSKQAYAKYKLSYFPHLNSSISKQATHKTRKVAPAIETMTKVSENELGDRSLVTIEFEALIDFWLDLVFKLKSQQELLKIISISNGTESKLGAY